MSKEVKQPQGETVDELIEAYENYCKGSDKKKKIKKKLIDCIPGAIIAVVSGVCFYGFYNVGFNHGCRNTAELCVKSFKIGCEDWMGAENTKSLIRYMNEHGVEIAKLAVEEVKKDRKHK